jgi:hypothetical protein
VNSWRIPLKHTLALYKQKILRFWGLTAQRGWARLILDRFQDLVLSPGDSTAATREPDTVSHEHHTAFSRHWRGTVNTAGFGWRGGSGV